MAASLIPPTLESDMSMCFASELTTALINSQSSYVSCLKESGVVFDDPDTFISFGGNNQINIPIYAALCKSAGPDTTSDCCSAIFEGARCEFETDPTNTDIKCKQLLEILIVGPYECSSFWSQYGSLLLFIAVVSYLFLVGASCFKHTKFGALLLKNRILWRQDLCRSLSIQFFEALLVATLAFIIVGITEMDVTEYVVGNLSVLYSVPDTNRALIYQNLRPFGGLFFLILFTYPIASMTISLVTEKESRMKAAIRMAGVGSALHITTWIISFLFTYVPLVTAAAIITHYGDIFPNTRVSTIGLFFIAFLFAMGGLGYLVTAFFQQTRPAAVASICIAYGMSFFSFYYINTNSLSLQRQGCWFAPVGLAVGVNSMLASATRGSGFAKSVADYNQLSTLISVEKVTESLVWTGLLYYFLGFYFDNVVPQQYGVRRKPYFLVEPFIDLWRYSQKRTSKTSDIENEESIVISDLRKVYKVPGLAGDRVAVDNISLSFRKGELTVLLGPNGCGKSTTFAMLTGLIEPTSGDVSVFGLSIRTEMHKIRRRMGWCPQQDILYPTLTVMQHLDLFASLRGKLLDSKELKPMLRELDMLDQQHSRANALSGGQRRKLCLAMALIGDTDVIYLDEASTGVDPNSRRHMWNVLQNHRKGRAIVMSTHFMDEADVLADTVAIMSSGKICCMGSTLELKKKYGSGYTMSVQGKKGTKPNQAAVMNLLATKIPGISTSSTMKFQLPFDRMSNFPKLFRTLESKGNYEVSISMTSLEEVFLKVADDTADARISTPIPYIESKKQNPAVYLALVKKRFLYAKRDGKLISFVLVLPLLFTLTLLIMPQVRLYGLINNRDGVFKGTSICEARIADGAWAYTSSNPVISYPSILTAPVSTDGKTCCQAIENPSSVQKTKFEECIELLPQCVDMRGIDIDLKRENCGFAFSFCLAVPWICQVDKCCDPTNSDSPFYLCQPNVYLRTLDIFDYDSTSENVNWNNMCPTFDVAYAQGYVNSFIRVMALLFGYVFPAAAVISFAVMEVESETKFQQLVNGVNKQQYWIAAAFFDHFIVTFPVIPLPLILYAAPFSALNVTNAAIWQTTALTFGFVYVCVSLSYAMSFLYKQHANALIGIVVFNIITGGLIGLLVYIVEVINVQVAGVNTNSFVNDYLQYILNFFPGFAFSHGILSLQTLLYRNCVSTDVQQSIDCTSLTSLVEYGNKLQNNEDITIYYGEYSISWSNALVSLTYMLFIYVLSWTFVFYKETSVSKAAIGFCCGNTDSIAYKQKRLKHKTKALQKRVGLYSNKIGDTRIDDQVGNATKNMIARGKQDAAEEELRVKSQTTDIVQSLGLTKRYGRKTALDDLWLGLKPGEIFGYLGNNGAGKSSTIKLLTGQTYPSRGSATVNGSSIRTATGKAQSEMGYCPQFDALFDLLTVVENLAFYATIRGLSHEVVNLTVRRLQLTKFQNVKTCQLSGGNKRKLSAGIAMLGNPKFIILDEPSSGMDPHAQRFMWNVIKDTVERNQCTVMLTSHSLPEVEALCDRIGILIDGKLRCLGTGEHLKSMYGRGFDIQVLLYTDGNELQQPITQDFNFVTKDNAQALCKILGYPERAAMLGSHSVDEFRLIGMLSSTSKVTWNTFATAWLEMNRAESVMNLLYSKWGGEQKVLLKNSCRGLLTFSVARGNLKLYEMFELLEENKEPLHIQHYSISQSSLEEIFNTWVETTK